MRAETEVDLEIAEEESRKQKEQKKHNKKKGKHQKNKKAQKSGHAHKDLDEVKDNSGEKKGPGMVHSRSVEDLDMANQGAFM